MSRVIKFRAWYKLTKEWLDPDLFIITNEGFYPDFRDFDDGQKLQEGEYELMQFTGLLDKNGVEIYEGDIIKWDEKAWGAPYTEVVKWEYDLLYSRETDWPKFGEVIGNIYQKEEQK